MGLIVAVLVTLAVALGLWKIVRLSSAALTLAGAGLALGLAGYAWQGRPSLRAHNAAVTSTATRPASDMRSALKRGDGLDQLARAEELLRRGNADGATNALQTALRENPRKVEMWVGLGNLFVENDHGRLSPAAEYCYEKAIKIDPNNLALLYFYGLSLASSGRSAEARTYWLPLVKRLPANAPQAKQVTDMIVQSGVLRRDEIPHSVSAK
jgi:cytochrome c-type biogenesis protein CcmH